MVSLSLSLSLSDQTPTPTRFLRNCEESGLFQELADNPFEQVRHTHTHVRAHTYNTHMCTHTHLTGV